jgi:hypothetical protein
VKDAKCEPIKVVAGGGSSCVELEAFQWVNTMIENIKTSMYGAYHPIDPRHLTRYVELFCYRFNRHIDLSELLPEYTANFF